ncbi:MAG: tyrosine-type recombinase/integrase [Cellvibrio sp.]
MALHRLSARKVATAGEGKHEDGKGLRLVVSATGAKKWVFRFTFNGKRREMGLGSFPTISLERARALAHDARVKIVDGIDPIQSREDQRKVIPSFQAYALEYIELNKAGWSNEKHQTQWVNTLATYAFPIIGNLPVNKISTDQIIQLLKPIWIEKNETAKRVQTRIAKILDSAKARGLRTDENPARWQGHLDTLLPKPSSIQKETHHPAMPYKELPGFWRKISSSQSISSYALRLLILTACRTSEVLQAKWDEFDFEENLWVIPAERMKAKREHRVPLSNAALALLKNLPTEAGSPYLFPGGRANNHLSNMALLKYMRDLGYGPKGEKGPYVPHGFRSTFRDWAGEESHYPQDVAEMALAHTIKNKVEAAYRRGDLLEKRREMMEDWAGYVS